MSIKFSHVEGLSLELASAVGLYEAAELSLDDIDMSVLDDLPGDGGEAVQALSDEADEYDEASVVEVGKEEAAQTITDEPAPCTPPLPAAFTSSSLSPIAPPAVDVLPAPVAILSDEVDPHGQEGDSRMPHLPDCLVQNLTQLSWLRKCGVGLVAEAAQRSDGGELKSRAIAASTNSGAAPGSSSSSLPMEAPLPGAAATQRGGPSAKAKRRKLGLRKDTPVIQEPGRGSRTRALDAGLPQRRASTLARLAADEVAKSGVGPKQSRWKTWCAFHRNWFGDSEPVLPLTMQSLAAVIGQLKEGRYHAAADYASTAKSMHLRKYEWSSMLARQQNVCLRSALRGLGPAKQCGEIELHTFTFAAKQLEAVDKTVPVGFYRTGVVGYFFMLREIELSLMLWASVTIEEGPKIVRILLPASKTDPTALSCIRYWGCVCEEDGPVNDETCPFHAAQMQKLVLKELFGDRVEEEGFTFAPRPDGGVVSKALMVRTVQKTAKTAGLELKDDQGRDIHTGHFMRIGGTRHMIKMGLAFRRSWSWRAGTRTAYFGTRKKHP